MKTARTLGALMTALALAGCGDGGPAAPADKVLVAPDLGDGKADVAERVAILGTITPEAPAHGRFERDGEYHGLQLTVTDGARVTLEITAGGSDEGLDTALFVFGPYRDGYDPTPVVWDDDSGREALSKIVGFPLAGGDYLVVVGTADGHGRGAYELRLTCEAGRCDGGPALTPVALGAELDDLVTQSEARCGDACDVHVAAFAWPPGEDPDVTALLAGAARVMAQPEAPWDIVGPGDPGRFARDLDSHGLADLPAALGRLAGATAYDLGYATHLSRPWPDVDALGAVWLLAFREADVAAVVELVDYAR